jgi:hypothetical protein
MYHRFFVLFTLEGISEFLNDKIIKMISYSIESEYFSINRSLNHINI